MKKIVFIKTIALAAVSLAAQAAVAQDIKVSRSGDTTVVVIDNPKKYLILPVEEDKGEARVLLDTGSPADTWMDVRLAQDRTDYCVPFALGGGSKAVVRILNISPDALALRSLRTSDTWSVANTDYYRPLYHHTPSYGWMNDANGMVYKDGEYHLYFQYNPYGSKWGNMHWGHAVSTDLVHWREMPLALHPDTLGTIFSGSAVIDYGNTAGWNSKDGTPALVAFYTSAKGIQRQSMAYSLDEGMTFTKYEGNPIIDSHEKWQTNDTRDPKVFWYAPGKHWVMVLNERDGHSIYNSVNLKDWTYQSHITGFWECPELFEVAVDGNGGNKKWVMWGASGTYMIGSFDGKTFTPDGPKLCNLNGSAYAAQVFNNIPANDGRVIKIAWGRISFEGMPFNGCMLLPQEQMLFNTRSGLRLASRPVREVEQLFTKVYSGEDLSMRQANDVMRQFDGDDVLRIRMTMHLSHATDAGLSYRGQRIVNYDMNGNRLNGEFYATDDPGSMMLTADVYMDRSMAEVFVDGGMYSYSMGLDVRSTSKEGYVFWGNNIKIRSLEVYKVKSIWDGYAE